MFYKVVVEGFPCDTRIFEYVDGANNFIMAFEYYKKKISILEF